MTKPVEALHGNQSNLESEMVVMPHLEQMLEDISDKMRLPSRLDPGDCLIRDAFDSAYPVAAADVRGTIIYVNRKFCEMSGYSEEELIGSNHRLLNSGEHSTSFFRGMYRQIAYGKAWHGEICNRRKDGSLYWVDGTIVPHIPERGKISRCTSIWFDITERKLLEEELRASKENLKRLASIDPLTDLANRRRFQEHISSLVHEYPRTKREFHLALLDVDRFKEVHDTFGHPAGDDLLKTVATRLRAMADQHLLVARLGGDEFGLILTACSSEQANAVLEAAIEAIRQPMLIAGTSRRCSASLGVATFPMHAEDGAALLKAAGLALHHAKMNGRDRIENFQPEFRDIAEKKAFLLAEIEGGLRQGAFEFHYQPIVPLADHTPVSLEALMRWRHPQRGLLSPAGFQEGFADQQVRAAFGMYMLTKVFGDVTAFQSYGLAVGRIALNLTSSDFQSDAFLDHFFKLSAETGVPLSSFCAEVTEGMFLGPSQKRVEWGLHRLHEAGVEIALDDFGTGFASLTHLRQLPIDRLKIDRSFVANMVLSNEDQAIVRGVIDIAHNLGVVVTAEGVETVEQVELLTDLGCDMLQGWYFGKACEAGRLPALLGALPDCRIQRA
ncbi:putative bifunctional diguanylate cyclase/phosphodiesterase [Bosea rubneri]|uniref:EAL domain-containing protein n=1 Tax=Bosea rubneri TaxID=3075434 RepID=A0ABU3SDM3_9HYPH|nr:EAL domain-containing protein [Bosea sp. ZW T0_25]MDU0342892.1 EAL domain-containing protein [Bosea sp. ZW T0_25]